MMELTITINAPDLSEAISRLADAIGKTEPVAAETAIVPAEPKAEAVQAKEPEPEPVPADLKEMEVKPTPAVMPKPEKVAEAPKPEPAPEPAVVPQAKKITLKELCDAGAGLVESGKMDDVINLLNKKYGVQAVNKLDESQYAAFADDLRALGAKL